jgi:phage tail P2-like protein
MEHILPPATTVYNRVLASEVQRLLDLEIPSKELWNPWTCPEAFLPYLAVAMSVDIWNPDWPVTRKRSVIAQSFQLHALKGTEEGIRRHLDLLGVALVDVIAPPQ